MRPANTENSCLIALPLDHAGRSSFGPGRGRQKNHGRSGTGPILFQHRLNNSGFEYVADFSQEKFEPLRHLFLVEKEFSTGKHSVFSLGAGFVWTSNKKYSGPLSDKDTGHNSFQFILRPNLKF